MRNSTGGTSSAKKGRSNNEDSAKKLVQARLPFKVIAPGSSPVASVSTTTTDIDAKKDAKSAQKSGHKDTSDARKRKLSYDESDDDVKAGQEPHNISKENVEVIAAASKKKKIAAANSEVEIVSLLDDDEDDAVNDTTVAKDKSNTTLKTPKTITLKGKRGKGAGTPQTSSAQRDKKDNSGSASKLQIKLPLSAGKKSKRRKSKVNNLVGNASSSHDTSQQNNSYADSSDDIEEVSSKLNPQKRTKLDHEEEKEKDIEETTKKSVEAISLESDSDESGTDVGKSQEKLNKSPESDSDKTKSAKSETHITNRDQSENKNENISSSDGTSQQNAIEEVSIILSPQKCNRLDNEEKKEKDVEETTKKCVEDSGSDESGSDDSKSRETRMEPPESSPATIDNTKSQKKTKANITECQHAENKDDDPEDSVLICSDDDNDDADDETENASIKNVNVSSDISEDSKSRHNVTIESIKDAENGSLKNKSLTPKQKKLMERRQRVREEKERKLQEEKRIKQQEKEEKELAKKREREDKEEQKRKEREEKEDLKRKEREEKERKRLAEIEAKRKRNEAKEEEVRKKEEDRKRKEQEKEEAEFKKKKAAEAFTKFFVPKAPSNAQPNIEDDDNTGDGTKILAFRPFQIKGDMKLAPLCRKVFSDEAKHRLDSLLGFKNLRKVGESDKMDIDFDGDSDGEDIVRTKPLPKSKLYLSELRCGKIVPGKWRRPSTESKDDVVIIEDELERVGEAIVADTPAYVREEMRVKFYKFHDNRRPPYYGTWRKKSSVINAKKPFAQDKEFFDYDVDSDDEWEEEEPGESLEDGSDDDKEKESEDEDYEVDNEWFVPHGHLSDEEMQNEDELGNGDDNTREAQKAKLQILQQEFAQEMKKKTEKIKPRLIGCIWIDVNGNQPVECPKIIWDTLNMRSMMCTEPPVLDDPELDEPSSPTASNTGNSEKSANDKIKPITVTDGMLKDLVRLMHGNNHSKNFLITEYIAYVQKTEETVKSGEFGNPLKTAVREKIDSIAEWQVVDATAASVAETNNSDALNESVKKTKKKNKKRLCWVVNQETLDRMNMSSLRLQNNWEYTLTPKLKLDKESRKPDESSKTIQQQPANGSSNCKTVDKINDNGKNTTSQITKFTKVLTAEEISNKIEKSTISSTSNISPKDSKRSTENKSKSPAAPNTQNPKEKKRVPLLMSVGRGQQISTPAKNKLISQFLQKGNKDNKKSPAAKTKVASSPVSDDDDVVILD